jgi:hypothetical protein
VIPATCLGLTPPKSIRPDILANRDHITVTGDAITFEAWGDGSRVTLSRQEGDLLLVLPGFAYPGRHVSRRITQLGTGRAIYVSWFLRKRAIRRACDRSGWRFGYSPDPAERHLRRWPAWDWRASAYNFITLHGPFAVPDVRVWRFRTPSLSNGTICACRVSAWRVAGDAGGSAE